MAEKPSTDEARQFPELHINRAHSARMYNYYLRGKDNYEADRKAAQAVIEVFPGIFTCAQENRDFMHRATRVLAADHGITQWLDIGTGIPARPNLHEVAQTVVPHARIAYVDHDPIVLAHARALLSSTPEGHTAYVQADVREPESILADEHLREALDLTKPVALSLNALLHFIPDAQDPYGIVRRLLDALPSGSALAVSHCTPEFNPEAWNGITEIYTRSGTPVQFRTKSEVAAFFDGLDLIDPGIVVGQRWRPDAATLGRAATDADVSLWTGVAIKP